MSAACVIPKSPICIGVRLYSNSLLALRLLDGITYLSRVIPRCSTWLCRLSWVHRIQLEASSVVGCPIGVGVAVVRAAVLAVRLHFEYAASADPEILYDLPLYLRSFPVGPFRLYKEVREYWP